MRLAFDIQAIVDPEDGARSAAPAEIAVAEFDVPARRQRWRGVTGFGAE